MKAIPQCHRIEFSEMEREDLVDELEDVLIHSDQPDTHLLEMWKLLNTLRECDNS